mmetsp:Transcript_31952/g.69925  ORF Transcript_31952/g.69925 Transcript_31952/m.69925 type:complete len:232 (-) Transcript_31952:178-873(-)
MRTQGHSRPRCHICVHTATCTRTHVRRAPIAVTAASQAKRSTPRAALLPARRSRAVAVPLRRDGEEQQEEAEAATTAEPKRSKDNCAGLKRRQPCKDCVQPLARRGGVGASRPALPSADRHLAHIVRRRRVRIDVLAHKRREAVEAALAIKRSHPLPVLEQHDRRIALDVERREQRRLLCAVHFGDRDGAALRAVVEGRHLLVHGRQLLAVSAPGCIEFDEPVAMLCPVPV